MDQKDQNEDAIPTMGEHNEDEVHSIKQEHEVGEYVPGFLPNEGEDVEYMEVTPDQNVAAEDPEQNIYNCKLCDFTTNIKNRLKKHKKIHSGIMYTCRQCGECFTEMSTLRAHILRCHTTEKPYTCGFCDYTSLLKTDLSKHMKMNHDDKSTFSCSECNYTTNRGDHFVSHCNSHAGICRHTCDQCTFQTQSSFLLKTHILRNHTEDKPFACTLCNYKSAVKSDFMRHMKNHGAEKEYSCETCDYKTNRKDLLRDHTRTHTGERPYSCTQCDFHTTTSSQLQVHILRKHVEDKPYACSFCDMKCAIPGDLKRHVRNHTGERPYACLVCNYMCRDKTHLRQHSRTHTGERPHACDQCDLKFALKSNLTLHMRTHTGEQPYACDECDFKTSRMGQLRKHKSAVHAKKRLQPS